MIQNFVFFKIIFLNEYIFEYHWYKHVCAIHKCIIYTSFFVPIICMYHRGCWGINEYQKKLFFHFYKWKSSFLEYLYNDKKTQMYIYLHLASASASREAVADARCIKNCIQKSFRYLGYMWVLNPYPYQILFVLVSLFNVLL